MDKLGEKIKDPETEISHVYDGIKEENNPMPMWWIALFIICVSFGIIYWMHYTSGSGPTLYEEYVQDLQKLNQRVEASSNAESSDTEETLAAAEKDEPSLAQGKALYIGKCAVCHGNNLEGKIGPNLTDNYWTTGDGTRMAILKTIEKGSPAKGMPPWESLLKRNEMRYLVAFVLSKHGSNPSNAKASEGKEYKK